MIKKLFQINNLIIVPLLLLTIPIAFVLSVINYNLVLTICWLNIALLGYFLILKTKEEKKYKIAATSIVGGFLALFSPGEVIDRIQILALKFDHCTNKEDKKLLQDQINLGDYLFNIFAIRLPKDNRLYCKELIRELYSANKAQWEWEDKVREEMTFEAVQEARINNTERVRIKNEINQLFSCPVEIKIYKGEKD